MENLAALHVAVFFAICKKPEGADNRPHRSCAGFFFLTKFLVIRLLLQRTRTKLKCPLQSLVTDISFPNAPAEEKKTVVQRAVLFHTVIEGLLE